MKQTQNFRYDNTIYGFQNFELEMVLFWLEDHKIMSQFSAEAKTWKRSCTSRLTFYVLIVRWNFNLSFA